jgi:uncharacterized protein (DUF697 family)
MGDEKISFPVKSSYTAYKGRISMAAWKDIANMWKNVREVDLRPIREQAVRQVNIVLVGAEGSGRHTLAEQMRSDPARANMRTHTPVFITGLEANAPVEDADLIILMVKLETSDLDLPQTLANQWTSAGKKVLVFYNELKIDPETRAVQLDVVWDVAQLILGPANKSDFLVENFVPAVMNLLPNHHLSLGRHFPLFRVPVAEQLINDTSFNNAAYAFSTGLAEMAPALGIPVSIADMVVLTKAQAFLVYRLGLAIGFSTRWQDYVAEFGSVIGGGFMWRQLARSLVGLIPVWGMIPKVAVAYAGTYVVGHAILRWYITGRHVSPKQIREMYRQSFRQGMSIARGMLAKAPRPRLPGRQKKKQLPPPEKGQTCPVCGKTSSADAQFCQYCGQSLAKV